MASGAASSTTNTPGAEWRIGRPQMAGPSAISPTSRSRSAAVRSGGHVRSWSPGAWGAGPAGADGLATARLWPPSVSSHRHAQRADTAPTVDRRQRRSSDGRPRPSPLARHAASASARRPCSSSRRWSRASACSAVPAETPSGVAAAATSAPHGISVAGLAVTAAGAASPVATATQAPATERATRAHGPAHRPSRRRRRDPTAAPPAPTATPEAARRGGTTAVASRKALQRRLDAWRAKHFVPGVSVAMLWDDGRTWLGASGDADVAYGRAVTRRTPASPSPRSPRPSRRRSSCELVDEGKLQLDERVAPLLPALGIDRRVTVRMLLDHTSDLNDFFFNPKIDHALQSNPDATWTAKRTWRYVPAGPHPAGQGLELLEHQLPGPGRARQGGRPAGPLAKEIRARLLDPLDLEHGLVPGRREAARRAQPGLPAGAASTGGARAVPVAPASDVMPFRSVVTAAGGAGSIAATAEDTARWMQAFAGGEVLSPAMQTAMLGDVAYTRALHARIPYGLGIQLRADRGPSGARPLGPLPRLPERGPLPARRTA